MRRHVYADHEVDGNLQEINIKVNCSHWTILLTHFPLIHPRQPHLCGGHLPVVQPMSRAVQLHWGALEDKDLVIMVFYLYCLLYFPCCIFNIDLRLHVF